MSNTPKRVGLMGCGTVARYGHIPCIANTEGLSLHAIYDPDPKQVADLQQKYNVPHAGTDLSEFFASDLDAVSITSPAPCHLENVRDAAAHKLPVLCEKPLAMTAEEAATMTRLMHEAGVPLHTAFCYRFSESALKIRELVREKAVGEVLSLRLIFIWHLHGKYQTDESGARILQKRRVGRMLEGGPMVDCGAHQIDLAHFWLNSPVIAYDAYGAWVEDYEAPDHMWLHMDHAIGAHTMVEMSYSYHQTSKTPRAEFVYELIGTEGVIRYDRPAQRFTVDTDQGTTELPFHHEKNFEAMYAEWARSLVSGSSELLTTGEEATRVTELARGATNLAIRHRRELPATPS